MNLVNLGSMELKYVSLSMIDHVAGGQIYGVMEGSVYGERLNGTLSLTNLAQRRPDNVNLPALRGTLSTDDGATVWVELDGIAMLRASDSARIFVTTCRFLTSDDRYLWLNTVLGAVEGVLDQVAVGGFARCQLFQCEATIE
jgi:hypothetical protein